MLSENHGGEDNHQDHRDDAGEGRDDGAADFLAEISELVANGQPVGAGVAVVGQVDDRRGRGRC